MNEAPYQRSAVWYDLLYGGKAYRDEALTLRGLIERARPQARSLLEVGCGTGGHLQYLQHWYACEGIDLSEPMIHQARAKVPNVPVSRGDMRDFELGRGFDAVVSLFSCIGYVRSVDELNAAIACMARHLDPGGVLIVEPWFTPQQWKPGTRVHGGITIDEPELKLVRMVVSEQRGRFAVTPMHHLVATLDGVQHFVETHELFLAEAHEYQAAFEAAGLEAIRHEPDVFVRGAWIGRAS